MEDLRYPIGRLELKERLTDAERSELIDQIAETPVQMREAVRGLDDTQLDTAYREGGWTVRQVVHHVADSSLAGYVRFKWAATEDHPTLKPYDGDSWAELGDVSAPVDISLDLLETLHRRWAIYLRELRPEDFQRPIVHPESGEWTVDGLLELYAWHGRHHVAHVTGLRSREGW